MWRTQKEHEKVHPVTPTPTAEPESRELNAIAQVVESDVQEYYRRKDEIARKKGEE